MKTISNQDEEHLRKLLPIALNAVPISSDKKVMNAVRILKTISKQLNKKKT